MAPTPEKLVELIRESGLLEPDRLDSYLKYLGNELPADSRELADRLVSDKILTDFQSEQLLKGRAKGFILGGKYKVLKLLGVGGMGRVFLAEHLVLKRLVAIKVLSPSQAKDPSVMERFLREARAVAALDDPNILRIFDVEPDAANPLMIMEFVDGLSLQELVSESGPLPLEFAANYIAQAALGLQHAMDIGIIHRDIKPGNLLLDRQGTVKIADMGLAKFRGKAGNDSSNTERFDSEHVFGTADYLAPEQAIDSSHVDIRVDIYGLGGTFYHLLTGDLPFTESTVAGKILAHKQRPIGSVRLRQPDLPKEIDEVIARMMAKKPKERYQTPMEVVDALAPWTDMAIGPPNFAWFARNPTTAHAGANPEASTDEMEIAPISKQHPGTSRVTSLAKSRNRDHFTRNIGYAVGGILLLAAAFYGVIRAFAP